MRQIDNFNPLRREGGDTLRPWTARSVQRISIHSAARAETMYGDKDAAAKEDFNPLRREGGDGAIPYSFCLSASISIHSAARAETEFW